MNCVENITLIVLNESKGYKEEKVPDDCQTQDPENVSSPPPALQYLADPFTLHP